MEYRRLGRTELRISVVGLGTYQLQLTPKAKAIDTLLKGFDLGVNIVHTAPDYGSTESLVAQALNRTERKVIVASQGYDVPMNENGPVSCFESLFEATCARFSTQGRLDLFGIACIDDREARKENVWGKNGMVEFLQKKKEQGMLCGIFCTTHGAPGYVERLVTCGVFDAIMLAHNILGYHLLSCNPPPDRHFECLTRNQREIFPLCKKHDVGLMIMKPFAGGLLCQSRAFPPRLLGIKEINEVRSGDIIRSILLNPEVTCVLPGTASTEEAEENALSGYAPIALTTERYDKLNALVKALQKTVCSRCGACEAKCSQGVPISWIFRSALINLYPAAAYELHKDIEYFRLHPQPEAICKNCSNVTCVCPNGIDIPKSLDELHQQMLNLMDRRLIPPPTSRQLKVYGNPEFGARVLSRNIPGGMCLGQAYFCGLQLENVGTCGWFTENNTHQNMVVLGVFAGEHRLGRVSLPHDVHSGGRCNILFEVTPPRGSRRFRLRLRLLVEHEGVSGNSGIIVFSQKITLSTEVNQNMEIHKSSIFAGITRYYRGAARRLRGLPGNLSQLRTGRKNKNALLREGTNPGIFSSTNPQKLYAVAWLENNLPVTLPKGGIYQVYIRVENIGLRHWIAQHPEGNCVDLILYINENLHTSVRAPHDVKTGERAIFNFPMELPLSADNGVWEMKFSFVEQNVAWFHQKGVEPLVVKVKAGKPAKGPNVEAMAISRRVNRAFWLPSERIIRSRTGFPYPTFIKQAEGCRIRDLEGNEWIDYVMAGGSAILGYAHPEISHAIERELHSSALITLPHMLEIEASQMLSEVIPCAELVLFGKNGSDVCTASIRIARLHTGRRKVLFSGYHGWQDWFAEVLEPELRSLSEPQSLFRFSLNDLASFRALVKEHSGEIAAVILEPAAQAESIDGPVRDADPGFLHKVAQTCRKEGAVLIFDEIITGFRYPKGSVQKATGVTPDLACFGKALSAGMPLSALVGNRAIMENGLLRAVYYPTFRGEVYSIAAAVAALKIYRSQDVPEQIHSIGLRIMNGINRISQELGVEGEMLGLPFRMIYKFHEPDNNKRCLKRTLLQQELLQRGILTFQGYMLPCLAHGEEEMEKTLAAFRASLKRVKEVSSEETYARYLDIPLLR